MAAEIWEAGDDVRRMASDIIAHHHPHLADAEIVYLMRSPAARSRGREVMGQAKKASAQDNALYPGTIDFIITLSGQDWRHLTDAHRQALLDHELCHCAGNSEDGWEMRGHDVEEFAEIIRRHGTWTEDLRETRRAMEQMDLFGGDGAGIDSVTLEYGDDRVDLCRDGTGQALAESAPVH